MCWWATRQVAIVIIGAMLVGSIHLSTQRQMSIRRMDELGYFAFGGSTLVCLFRPGAIEFDRDLLDNSARQLETLVRVGNSIGRARDPVTATAAAQPSSL